MTNRKIKIPVFISVSILLLMTFFSAFSQVSKPAHQVVPLVDTITKQEYFLELKGNVRQSKAISEKEEIKPIDSALIEVYIKDIPFTQVYTNKKGRCVFKLPLGKLYKIVVSKKGFTTKFFEVNTIIPNDKINTYSFSFDIDLFEEIKDLNISILKKPIAKVMFNLIVEQFVYDINYTSRINFDLKKMYKSYYYLLQKSQVDTLSTPSPNPVKVTKKQ